MTPDSGRAGSCVAAREPPIALLTLMITGSGDRRSRGRNAVVVRTTPATLTSNTQDIAARQFTRVAVGPVDAGVVDQRRRRHLA